MKTRFCSILILSAFFAFTLTSCANYSVPVNIENAIKAEGLPLAIGGVYISRPNSAGGVDLTIFAKNLTDREIRYISYDVRVRNRVGDIVYCTVRGSDPRRVQVVGPIKPGQIAGRAGVAGRTVWKNNWYNHSIVSAEIVNIRVTYMSLAVEDFGKEDVDKMVYGESRLIPQ